MAGHMQLQVVPYRRMELLDLFGDDPDFDVDYWVNNNENDIVWASRYSALGYLDATGWCLSKKGPIDAAYAAFKTYSDETDIDERRELAQVIWQARAQGYRK